MRGRRSGHRRGTSKAPRRPKARARARWRSGSACPPSHRPGRDSPGPRPRRAGPDTCGAAPRDAAPRRPTCPGPHRLPPVPWAPRLPRAPAAPGQVPRPPRVKRVLTMPRERSSLPSSGSWRIDPGFQRHVYADPTLSAGRGLRNQEVEGSGDGQCMNARRRGRGRRLVRPALSTPPLPTLRTHPFGGPAPPSQGGESDACASILPPL